MKKEFRVFFSWQSDLSSSQTRRFIEECIEEAQNNMPDTIDLIPDEATREKFGSPDIMDSICEKIDECDLFIADVSIVGRYISTKEKDEEEPEEKLFPNPNVLLELGYASGTISWDRCICLANTKYGEIADFPFDLNHRRITAFSYTEGGRKKEINHIAEIIKSTVIEYSDKPLPKKNFSHHIIGGFNFTSGVIEQRIAPYNERTLGFYTEHTKRTTNEIITLIEKISEIHLPPAPKEENIEAIPKGMSFSDAMKDPVLSKSLSLKFTQAHPVKFERSFIGEYIKKYLEIEVCDDFYDVGGLKECSFLASLGKTSFEGTEMEKAKYDLLLELESKLLSLEIREMYMHVFDGVAIIPLAIMNSSTKNDERIAINIKVIDGTPINPSLSFFNPDFEGLEGFVYDEHLVQELLQLPENGLIKFDSSISRDTPDLNVSHFSPPIINGFGCISCPESNAEDYEDELNEYIQSVDEGTDDEYSFTIGALRPRETVWLDKVVLIRPSEGKISIEYSIKSNNTAGDLTGKLIFEDI